MSLQLAKETKDINKKQKKDPKARGLKPCIRYPSCAMRHSLSYCNSNTFVPDDLMRPKTNQLMLISTNIKLLLKITLGKTCKVVEDEDGGWFHYYGTTKITLKSARCLWRNFISLLPLWVKRLIDGDGEVLLYVLKLYTEGGIPGVGKPLHIERRANMCWPNIGEQVTGKATPTP